MSRPTSQVSGLVSGIDWETTIQQLLAIESRPAALLSQRKQADQTKLSLWGSIQSKLSLLQSAAESIDTRAEFAVKSASSSDSNKVAVTADASASPGAHTVQVTQLAKAHRIASQGWADKNSTGVGDSGGNFVININGETINIADADLSSATTLEQLRNLINSSSDNTNLVTASILEDGSGSNKYRLVLSANDTGTANAITISSNPTNLNFSTSVVDTAETNSSWTGTSAVTSGGTYSGSTNKSFVFTIASGGTVGTDTIAVDWEDSLGNTGTVNVAPADVGNFVNVAEGVQFKLDAGTAVAGQSFNIDVFNPTLTAAQNANVQIDGVYMSKSSNSIKDVFEGVTLDLVSADPGTTIDISIANDKTAVKAKIQGFVDSYNSLMSDLSNFSAYDEKNKTAAPLLGDGFLSEIKSSLSTIATQAMSALPDGAVYDSLAIIGIKGSTKGLLTIDSTALDKALDTNYESVINLFTQSFSSDDNKISYQSSTSDTTSGEYALVVNYNASGQPTSATINGQSATVDGLLIKGAEGTGVEGLVLSFTSPGSGPGTVNTTIKFGKGVGASLASKVTQLTDSDNGTVHFATDNLNDNIESLDNQIEAWDKRLAAVEQRLRHQFSNLETALSQMKNQSNYLAGVLG